MTAGLLLCVIALVLRGASTNRHVRARLLASAVVGAAAALLSLAVVNRLVSPGMEQPVQALPPLLLSFGLINALVALAINPWRVDRLPDRFPTIVQDAIVIVLFAFVATILLQEKIFAATAVGAVVVGFALQDTLGNLFAGLAIQIEKPFRVGHWVRVADIDGIVMEITWRAVKVRTKSGNFVVVPNSKLADDIIINYSEPSLETRMEVEVGVTYDAPPNVVKSIIQDAIRDEPLISRAREPEVLLVDFAASSMTYRVRVWTTDFAADERLKDRIRSAIYYAFRRHNIEIPFPIQTEIQKEAPGPMPRDYSVEEQVLGRVAVFSSLGDDARTQLARAATRGLFATGEVIVRQDDPGASMFVVASGQVVVTIAPGGEEVARLGPGEFFGEMSLLTGAPRNATVRTTTDSELLEITVDSFRQFVLANPAAVDQIGHAVATRRAELELRRAAGSVAIPVELSQTFIDRIKRFLWD